jgi:hypothetical protein
VLVLVRSRTITTAFSLNIFSRSSISLAFFSLGLSSAFWAAIDDPTLWAPNLVKYKV